MFIDDNHFELFVFVLLMFGMGFIVQALAGFNPAINAIPIGGLIVVYIIFGLIYVPPIISLFKFSKNMKTAIENKNSLVLEESFGNLKSHFKYIGILTSIFVGLYAFAIAIVAIFGLVSKF